MIDLGDELKIEVKYQGQVYSIREPRVDEIDQFRDADESASTFARVSDFLIKLGMPQEIVAQMGASKVKALIDGLMSELSKKN